MDLVGFPHMAVSRLFVIFRMRWLPALILHTLFCLQLTGQIQFTDSAQQFGVNKTYGYGAAGGGVSFCDFNGDGLDDITFSTEVGDPMIFFRNTGNGFERLQLLNHRDQSKQVLWVDFDNDGDKDLYITSFLAANRLYENTGDLQFEDITESAGLPIDEFTTFGACWGDYDRDGWLDLYYGERRMGNGTTVNRLFRNNADGTFTDVSELSGTSDPGKIPFCSAFLDFNGDNWPDIYTANDKRTINTLLRNNGDGTFTDIGQEANADIAMDGMCVAVGDYDNDGHQDIYISNIADGNVLLKNKGPVIDDTTVEFEKVEAAAGAGFYGVAWGSNFLDANNDGFLDLYVSGVALGLDTVNSTFYINDGNGGFNAPDAGFSGDTLRSYSNAIGDFNSDGFPDILVVNHSPGRNQLWENGGNGQNWLKVELEGVISNRDAIGAKIEAFVGGTYQMRQIHCGIGFLAQNSETEILGLAGHEQVDSIRITWPTGHVDRLFEVGANQKIFVMEGSTTNEEIFIDPDISITTSTKSQYLSQIESLQITPNPTTAKINITAPSWMTGQFSIRIFNSKGQQVLTSEYQSPMISIDLAGLNSGVYFLILSNANGASSLGHFVKL